MSFSVSRIKQIRMLHVTFRVITLHHQNDYISTRYSQRTRDFFPWHIFLYYLKHLHCFYNMMKKENGKLVQLQASPSFIIFQKFIHHCLERDKTKACSFYQYREKSLRQKFRNLPKPFLQLLSAFGDYIRDHLECLLHNAKFYFSLAQRVLSKSQAVGFLPVICTTLSCKSLHERTPR